MRRLTIKILILAFLWTFVLTGCGSADATIEKSETQVIRIATDLSAEDAAYRQLKRFAQRLYDASEGQFTIKLYKEGQWDSNEALAEYLTTGALEMVCLSTDIWAAETPYYELYGYPALFGDAYAVTSYALSDNGQAALKASNKYNLLGFAANGYSYFLHKFWAENYYNYKGSTFYADISATTANTLKGLGINAVNTENNTPGVNHIVTEGDLNYLVQINVVNESNYLSNPEVYYNLELVAVSPLFWESLSKDEQNILREAFNGALKEECDYQAARELKEILPQGGVSLIPWTKESRMQAYQALRSTTENYLRTSQNPLGSYFLPVYNEAVN